MAAFVDHVRVYCKSGHGGKGVVSWRREKHVPMGGPDGGDGGEGGSIFLKGNSQLWTLLDLRYRKFITAADGNAGQGAKKKGRDAEDIILEVPLGTVAINEETGQVLGEIKTHGEKLRILKGGNAGRGNWQFRTATKQTPDYAEPGWPGEEKTIVLELKVLADVGLVGFPNAGKSTLLSVVSAAKPKIADYAFTTLVPNLGIVKYRDIGSFVMADIPGIIEGAHEGRGLGLTFLRHIERNALLLFLIPVDSEDPKKEFKTLLNELKAYNPELIDKERLLVLTKADLLEPAEVKKIARKFIKEKPMIISSALTTGLEELKDALWKKLQGIGKAGEDWA